jgi:predicted DNA-binding transcriptional regulator AlpA
MENRLLNKREVCDSLGISLGSLDGLMKRKEINYIKFDRNVRFEINEVERLINKKKVSI